MKVYCVIHHYGHSYNYESGYDTNYMNERDLVAVLTSEDLAKRYTMEQGIKLGAYCGQRTDWINKKRTKFGYEVGVGPR